MKELEELELKLNRGPAGNQVIDEAKRPIDINATYKVPDTDKFNYNQVKQIFDDKSPWDPAKYEKAVSPKNSPYSETMAGAVAPDFSGYDDILKNLEGRKPKDTSTADLISMAASTGLGLLFGRTGAAAKVAGNYGMDRFNKAEKRENELENLILKLQSDRAARMAKGIKGTKLKNGSGTDTYGKAYQNTYTDPRTGISYIPQKQDPETGAWVRHPDDPEYRTPSVRTVEQPLPDGTVATHFIRGAETKQMGSMRPKLDKFKTAKGETALANFRTEDPGVMGDAVNKTQMKLTPTAQKKYDEVTRQYRADGNLARYQQASSDLRAASAALGSDGELSQGFLLATQRFLGMGMDKGRSLTNDEFNKVEGVNTGIVDKLRNNIIAYKQGKVGSNEVRQEYRRLVALLSNNVENLRNERIGDYNHALKTGLMDEYRKDLVIPNVSGVSARQQDSDVKRAEKLSGELRSDKPEEIQVSKTMPDGTVVKKKVKLRFNPKTGRKEVVRE